MKEMKQMAPTTSELFVWNAAANITKMTPTAPIMSKAQGVWEKQFYFVSLR
jgi:hypothetical protein